MTTFAAAVLAADAAQRVLTDAQGKGADAARWLRGNNPVTADFDNSAAALAALRSAERAFVAAMARLSLEKPSALDFAP